MQEGVFHVKAHAVMKVPIVDPALGKKTSVIFQIQDGTGALNRVGSLAHLKEKALF